MQDKNYRRAWILTRIPVVLFGLTAGCLLLAAVLEVPSGRGILYSFFALTGLLSMFLSPLRPAFWRLSCLLPDKACEPGRMQAEETGKRYGKTVYRSKSI